MAVEQAYLEDTATSSASVREVVVCEEPTSAAVVRLALRAPVEERPGKEALKVAMSSSGGFCELVLEKG